MQNNKSPKIIKLSSSNLPKKTISESFKNRKSTISLNSYNTNKMIDSLASLLKK